MKKLLLAAVAVIALGTQAQAGNRIDPIEIMVTLIGDNKETKDSLSEGLGNLLLYIETCDRRFERELTPQTSRFVATFVRNYREDVDDRYDEAKSRIAKIDVDFFCTKAKPILNKWARRIGDSLAKY